MRVKRSATILLGASLLLAAAALGAGRQTGLITPLGVDSSGRYFADGDKLTVLVGVSADIACHLHLGSGSDFCTFDKSKPGFYEKVLADAAAKGLNKIRLVVAINGIEPDAATSAGYKPVHPEDHPFEYVPGPKGALGVWRLDQRNETFFRNLRRVVEFAGGKGIYVEVTFFAPGFGMWEKGPWHKDHGRIGREPAGFTSRSEFVTVPPGGDPPPLARVRQIQKNVIRWTIDALWDQPHVWWEIANEPESDAAAIRSWQEMMIEETVSYETAQYVSRRRTPRLTRPHLVAVQPFSKEGLSHYAGNSKVAVINGHYTRVSSGAADLGAIDLVRNPPAGRILGFNEGKISGIGGTAGSAGGGKAAAVRAEAWEFALHGGAAFDHFGYNYSSPDGAQVRDQLGKLRSFLAALPLREMVPAADPPAWIDLEAYDASRADPKLEVWAALEPKPKAAGVPTYAVYIHHSKSRQLAFDGYDPILRDAPPFYNAGETYKLCFGAAAGTYEVDWICPENGERTGGQTIDWPGSATCARGGPGSVAVQPPAWPGGNAPGCHYSYDIGLRIRKVR